MKRLHADSEWAAFVSLRKPFGPNQRPAPDGFGLAIKSAGSHIHGFPYYKSPGTILLHQFSITCMRDYHAKEEFHL